MAKKMQLAVRPFHMPSITDSFGGRIVWDDGIADFSANELLAKSPQIAAYHLFQNRISVTFNTLKNLESLPITIPSTEEIINGNFPTTVGMETFLKVRAFVTALDDICDSVYKDTYHFSHADVCWTHGLAAKADLESTACGCFRYSPVKLGNLAYKPPSYEKLKKIWEEGFSQINKIVNPVEKSVIAFLWLSRNQFFADCNKRTAFLHMNGLLCSNSCNAIIFPSEDQVRFMANLRDFYETGEANGMVELIHTYAANNCVSNYITCCEEDDDNSPTP